MPTYDEVVQDGERLVSKIIVAMFLFALLVFLVLTTDQPVTHYKPPCEVSHVCRQR